MVRALNAKERKHLVQRLEEAYGFTGAFDYVVFAMAEDKYHLVTRDAEAFLDKNLRIERLGIYFGQDVHGEFRLSIEGSQLIGPHATQHVLEITPAQRNEWMLGKDLILDDKLEQTFYIVKCAEDYCGSGKFKNGTFINFVPKERYVGATFETPDATD